jgi:hypothetical protein
LVVKVIGLREAYPHVFQSVDADLLKILAKHESSLITDDVPQGTAGLLERYGMNPSEAEDARLAIKDVDPVTPESMVAVLAALGRWV